MAGRRIGIFAALLALMVGLLPGVPAAVGSGSSSEFVGIEPVRVADTRDGTGGVPVGKVMAGTTLSVPVAGRYGVPADAKAVSLNVTVTQPVGSGFVTAYPCGTTRPLASNLNFVAGQTVPNAVVVKTGASGAVCLHASVTTHLLADLNGYFPGTADYTAIVPVRVADTRYGTGVAKAMVPAGQTLAVPVAGRHGIADDASSVAANVTVTEPAASGYVTVWPCGEAKPFASNLNYVKGQTVPNAVIAGVGDSGAVCLSTTATTHLIVDVGGYFTPAALYEPLVPERVFDTRIDWDRTKLPAGWYIEQPFAEPGELVAVVLNVTVTQPNGPGFITVYPCSPDPPLASNLNFVKGQTVPNMVIAPVSPEGTVCFYTSQTTHILADVNGVVYSPDTTPPGAVWGLVDVANLNGSVTLSWTNPADDDFAGARVLRSEGVTPPSPGEGQEVALTDPTATSVTDTGLMVGHTYSYAVYAYDWSGNTGPAATLTLVARSSFRAQSVGSGANHICAIDADDRAWCWGSNGSGQLGIPPQDLVSSPEPLLLASANRWTGIGGGLFHSCAVTEGGAVQCWGGNSSGELGIGQTGPAQPVPVEAVGPVGVVQIAVGGTGACARDTDGKAWCWGAGRDWGPTPKLVGGGHPYSDITSNGVGSSHACGLDGAGRAWCWGDNYYGELGNGAEPLEPGGLWVPLSQPTEVAGDHRFVQISAGRDHTCAVDTQGATWCWGQNISGKLGNGVSSGTPQRTPIQVATAPTAVDVFAADSSTCMLAGNAAMWCWGRDAPNDGVNLPTLVAKDHTFLAADSEGDTCAIDPSSEVWCGIRRDQPRQIAYVPTP